MRLIHVCPAITAGVLMTALSAAWAAPGDPTPPAPTTAAAPQSAPARGRVSAVDATAKTVTITEWPDQSTAVLHVNDATKYFLEVAGTAADLKVGENVRVGGQATGSTLDARFIQILPAPEAPAPAGGGRFGTLGVIAAVTPSLTITTSDGQTDTVQMDNSPRIMKSQAGAFTDVTAGTIVNATTTGSADNLVATTVQVMPAGGFGGGRGG